MSDEFLCNWIKFIRPSSSREEANLIAYQQRGCVYLVSIGAIDPSAELRVYVRKSRSCSSSALQLPPIDGPSISISKPRRRKRSVAEESVSENSPRKRRKGRRKRTKEVSVGKSAESNEKVRTADCEETELPRLDDADDDERPTCEPQSTTEQKPARRKEGYDEWLTMKKEYKSGGMT